MFTEHSQIINMMFIFVGVFRVLGKYAELQMRFTENVT